MADSKYGVITTERKAIPPDEPVFLLRDQDRYAATAVRHYAFLLAQVDKAAAERVRAFADEMDAWPVKKVPD